MNTLIDPNLIMRLEAIKLAYACGFIASVPYIETDRGINDFSQIILKKEEEEDQQGGGATARGFKKNTRPKTQRR
jgi:hypothetical protein